MIQTMPSYPRLGIAFASKDEISRWLTKKQMKPIHAKMLKPAELLGAGLKLEVGDIVELQHPYNIPNAEGKWFARKLTWPADCAILVNSDEISFWDGEKKL